MITLTFVIEDEYDDAIRSLKKAEDNVSLETEADNAPRRKKLPKRYINSDEDNEDEDEENNMSTKKKVFVREKLESFVKMMLRVEANLCLR